MRLRNGAMDMDNTNGPKLKRKFGTLLKHKVVRGGLTITRGDTSNMHSLSDVGMSPGNVPAVRRYDSKFHVSGEGAADFLCLVRP